MKFYLRFESSSFGSKFSYGDVSAYPKATMV